MLSVQKLTELKPQIKYLVKILLYSEKIINHDIYTISLAIDLKILNDNKIIQKDQKNHQQKIYSIYNI